MTRIGREWAQFFRWLLHWVMIIVIHFILFEYLTWCPYETYQQRRYFDKNASYVCNSFQSNWALILVYLIYLLYLVLGAIQIREGLPELRSINAITKSDTLLNKWVY